MNNDDDNMKEVHIGQRSSMAMMMVMGVLDTTEDTMFNPHHTQTH